MQIVNIYIQIEKKIKKTQLEKRQNSCCLATMIANKRLERYVEV